MFYCLLVSLIIMSHLYKNIHNTSQCCLLLNCYVTKSYVTYDLVSLKNIPWECRSDSESFFLYRFRVICSQLFYMQISTFTAVKKTSKLITDQIAASNQCPPCGFSICIIAFLQLCIVGDPCLGQYKGKRGEK